MSKFTKNLINITAIFLIVFAIGMFANTTPQVKAGAGDNLSGYAWSDNIGWISFNCTDPGTCGTSDYGVKISPETGIGDFSGEAWSDNIGWISFDRVETGDPPEAPFDTGSGSDPIAKIDLDSSSPTYGQVTGWARALSGEDVPTLAGSLIDSTNINEPSSVFVSGNYAYVTARVSDSLAVVDISDPSNPTRIASLGDLTNMDRPLSVFVSGNYAYVAHRPDSLTVVDISDPFNPTLAGSYIDSVNMDTPQSVYVSGNYAYVVGFDSDSLAVVDISDPSNPTFAGSLIDSVNMNAPDSVYLSGNYAYLTSYFGDYLAVVDISDPSKPTFVSSLIDSTNLDGSKFVHVSGNYAYVAARLSDSFVVVDISDPSNPTRIASLGDLTNMDRPESIYVSGNYAYVAVGGLDSFVVVDISDPSNPTFAGSLTDSTNLDAAYSVYVSGGYAYVVGFSNDSLAVIDITTSWDGWIKLSGDWDGDGDNTSADWAHDNPVRLDLSTDEFKGYAWGSEVVGWIKFDSWPGFGVKFGTPNNPPTATIIAPGTDPYNAAFGASIAFSGSGSDPDVGDTIAATEWRESDCTSGTLLSSGPAFSKSDFTLGSHDVYFRVQDDKNAWSTCDSVNAIVSMAECNDSIDNDGDGLDNFPNDPGCSSATDNDESDDPECFDGIDNDGDGFCDAAGSTCTDGSTLGDPSCSDIFGDDEAVSPCNNNGACDSGETLLGCPRDCFRIREF